MPASPIIIEPHHVHTLESAAKSLGVSRVLISREIKRGHLRFAVRGRSVYIMGQWLLEWVQKGERAPGWNPGNRNAEKNLGRTE